MAHEAMLLIGENQTAAFSMTNDYSKITNDKSLPRLGDHWPAMCRALLTFERWSAFGSQGEICHLLSVICYLSFFICHLKIRLGGSK